jgi:Mn2+/Fe2+ NRAMP family transporter
MMPAGCVCALRRTPTQVGHDARGQRHRGPPGFYATYIACVGAAAAIVLIPHVPLQLVIISVQVFAGLILPSAIIFLQLLLNDHALLGDRWVNSPWNNWINWTIIVVLFALSLLLAAQVMLPKLFA